LKSKKPAQHAERSSAGLIRVSCDRIELEVMEAWLGFDWEEWPVMWFVLASYRLVLALIGKNGR